MIQKLQKIFHTDKWWGKVLVFAFFLIIFLCIENLTLAIENIVPIVFWGILIFFIFYFIFLRIFNHITNNIYMIQKLQKIFHTDKWWGKTILVVLFYLMFGIIFYGIWLLFLISFDERDYYNYEFIIFIISLFLHIILPVITFFVLPKFFKKVACIKHPYIVNSIGMFLILVIFLFFEILISLKQFFGQMFL